MMQSGVVSLDVYNDVIVNSLTSRKTDDYDYDHDTIRSEWKYEAGDTIVVAVPFVFADDEDGFELNPRLTNVRIKWGGSAPSEARDMDADAVEADFIPGCGHGKYLADRCKGNICYFRCTTVQVSEPLTATVWIVDGFGQEVEEMSRDITVSCVRLRAA